MSTSTVSISGNPTSRRRPLASTAAIDILGPNKSINLSPENGVPDRNQSNINPKAASLVVDRSKDPVSKKDSSVNDAVSPRRKSKRAAKPLWLIGVRVFVKISVLLVVLFGFVQLVYRLGRSGGGGADGVGSESGSGAVLELEERVAEIERSWKRTVKMMQLQVEVVDAKLGNRVAGLREEVGKRIEEKSVLLEREIEKLDKKIESLDGELGLLKLDKFLTKEEFETFYEEIKNVGSGEKEFSLDDLRDYAREVVETEIQKHAADGLGMVDYALGSAGGWVVKHSERFGVEKGSYLKVSRVGVHQDAEKMLTPSFGEPGQCFPLKGSSGFVHVRLRTAIVPEAFTLEHVDKSVAYDRSSAPKDCRVSGWLEGPEVVDSETNTAKMFLLSEFTYDLTKSNVQTFSVSDSASGGVVNMIRLDFTSNHGSPNHTCIYRVRVHGQEPKDVSMIVSQS